MRSLSSGTQICVLGAIANTTVAGMSTCVQNDGHERQKDAPSRTTMIERTAVRRRTLCCVLKVSVLLHNRLGNRVSIYGRACSHFAKLTPCGVT